MSDFCNILAYVTPSKNCTIQLAVIFFNLSQTGLNILSREAEGKADLKSII